MASYYETVHGYRCDRHLIDTCKEAVAGQGDGRVSVEDAKKVFKAAADAGKVTRRERWTLRYCLTHFKWTEAAQDFLVEELKKVPQEQADEEEVHKDAGGPKKKAAKTYYQTIDGMKLDRAIVDACHKAVEGKGDGRVSVEDAKKVFEKAADGGKITNCELWTLCYCQSHFKWTEKANDWFAEELAKTGGQEGEEKSAADAAVERSVVIETSREKIEQMSQSPKVPLPAAPNASSVAEAISAADAAVERSVVVETSREKIEQMSQSRKVPLPAAPNASSVAEAICAGAWGDVVRLVEAKEDVNSPKGGVGFGYTPLMILASIPGACHGDPKEAAVVMRYLVENGANPAATDDNKKTALHIVGKSGGHLDQMKVLLDAGVDVNAPMNGGYTPLWYVRNYKRPVHKEMDAMLVEAGAEQRPDKLE